MCLFFTTEDNESSKARDCQDEETLIFSPKKDKNTRQGRNDTKEAE